MYNFHHLFYNTKCGQGETTLRTEGNKKITVIKWNSLTYWLVICFLSFYKSNKSKYSKGMIARSKQNCIMQMYHLYSATYFYLRIECIFFVVLLACKSVDWGTFCVLHTKNVPWSTLLHAYKTTKKCIQFL